MESGVESIRMRHSPRTLMIASSFQHGNKRSLHSLAFSPQPSILRTSFTCDSGIHGLIKYPAPREPWLLANTDRKQTKISYNHASWQHIVLDAGTRYAIPQVANSDPIGNTWQPQTQPGHAPNPKNGLTSPSVKGWDIIQNHCNRYGSFEASQPECME